MFKKLVSLLLALSLSFSFLALAVSCTQEREDVAESEQFRPEESGELADDNDKSEGGKVEEEGETEEGNAVKPADFFEYLELIKDDKITDVLSVTETLENVKNSLPFMAQMNIVTREILINLALSSLKIDGVSDVKSLCNLLEEKYAYADFVADFEEYVDKAKEGKTLAKEEVEKYSSYGELIEAYGEKIDEIVEAVAYYASSSVSIALLATINAVVEGVNGIVENADVATEAVKEILKTLAPMAIEFLGIEKINEYAEKYLETTFEGEEDISEFIGEKIAELSEFAIDGLKTTVGKAIMGIMEYLVDNKLTPSDIEQKIIDFANEPDFDDKLAEFAETALPYSELAGKIDEISLEELDDALAYLKDREGYYNLLDYALGLEEVVLTEELAEQIVGYIDIVSELTVGDALDLAGFLLGLTEVEED